jgi:hypothetical protein
MEGVSTGVAPMVVLSERRPRACQFEELIGRCNSNFRREDLRFGCDDLGISNPFSIRVLDRSVNGVTGFSSRAFDACRRSVKSSTAWIV